MRKLLAVLAAISTLVLTVLVAPVSAQAASCAVSAHRDNGGDVEVGPDGTIGVYAWVTTTNCPSVKTTKLTIELPGSDMTATRSGKTVSMPISLGQVLAGRPLAGTEYRMKVYVTFVSGPAATRYLSVHFVQDTKINALATALGSGKVTISGTLYRYSWFDLKWHSLSGKKVGWSYSGSYWTPTTNSSGKFSSTMAHLPKGKVIAVIPAFNSGGNTYGTSVRKVSVKVK